MSPDFTIASLSPAEETDSDPRNTPKRMHYNIKPSKSPNKHVQESYSELTAFKTVRMSLSELIVI